MSENLTDNLTQFTEALVKAGWKQTGGFFSDLIKGEWRIWFDTTSWCNIDTKHYPSINEIHVPNKYELAWTIQLIEHLCNLEDERFHLMQTLNYIAKAPTASENVRYLVNERLSKCYHSYRGILDKNNKKYTWHCHVCGHSKSSEDEVD